MPEFKLGVVSFHNTLPLASGLEEFLPGASVFRDSPAAIAGALEAGDLDAGLVPVAALPMNPSWGVVPGLGIACRGTVGSVALLSPDSPEGFQRLIPDPASRTSNVLARLWLRRRLGRDLPEQAVPGGLEERLQPGAVTVCIGDEALFFKGSTWRGDLGEIWEAWTGLPFVFAVWAGPGAGDSELAAGLRACLGANLTRIEELARAAAGDADEVELIRRYLSDYICYRLGEAETEGLNTYLRFASEAGLLPPMQPVRCHAMAE